MLPHPFQAALNQPESDASHSLCTLISAGNFNGLEFPAIVETYLSAFCDLGRSVLQRRWIGIALTRMLKRTDCAAHIQGSAALLKNLGSVILSDEERRATKTVAGLIIRQGLEQNIDYYKFWPTEKVTNSAPNFPRDANAEWMQSFYVFLDSLGELALTSSNSKMYTRHVTALETSDGFKYREPGNGLPVAILEAGVLTILVSDEHLQNCRFVDIPVSHILSTRLDPSRPHDPQSRPTLCKSCSLIMMLQSEPWSYSLDSTQRAANEISLMFGRSEDALQWENSIKQHRKAHGARHNISRISPIDTGSSMSRKQRAQKVPMSGSVHRLVKQPAIDKPPEPMSNPPSPKPSAQLEQVKSRISPEDEVVRTSSTSKPTTYGKGRLPRVSRAAKQKALQQLGSHSGDGDVYAKKGEKEGVNSDTSSATWSLRRGSQHSKIVPSKKGTSSTKTRKSHSKYKGDDDEDYIPSQIELTKSGAKRKADVDPAKDGKQIKKPRVQPNKHANSISTATKRRDQSRALAEPATSAASSRHSLIAGLKASQKPASTANSMFKKPTLPPHITQPSTPTKPRKRPVETQRRLQTPRDARSLNDDAYSQMPSSPPIACEADEKLDWSQRTPAEAAILSSNSKPVPASPNAESTAISGHADCDAVAYEKRAGDSQTAKSDPFTRRSQNGKATSFLRRLTGEELTAIASDLGSETSHGVVGESRVSSTTEIQTTITVNQPLPQPTGCQKEMHDLPHTNAANAHEKLGPNTVNVASVQVFASSTRDSTSPRSKQAAKMQAMGSLQRSAVGVKEKTAQTDRITFGSDMNRPALVPTQEIVHNTPAKRVVDQDLGMEGSVVVDDYRDEQHTSEAELPPVYFNSSPPRFGSPSSHSSTSAEFLYTSQPPLPSSEAEEMEWEKKLEPHQRSLHDVLLRTSKRVVRHIVNSETGLNDIAETFAKDGECILDSLLQQHNDDYERVFTDMETKKEALRKELELATKRMADERKRMKALI